MTFNDFLSEIPEVDLWTYLSNTDKPIVMYGMGNGADKICEVLGHYGKTVNDYFASDDFVRGQEFHGKRVLTLKQLEEKYEDFIILVSFGTKLDSVIRRIVDISKAHELYLPDVPVAGAEIFNREFFNKYLESIKAAFELLEDDSSKRVFIDVVRYKLSGKIDFLLENTENTTESIKALFDYKSWKTILDLGAYNGDTIAEILGLNPQISKIIAFEPDIKNFKKLEKYLSTLNVDSSAYNICAWDKLEELVFDSSGNRNSTVSSLNHLPSVGDTKKVSSVGNSVDNILNGERVDYINYDVEGAELKAIRGSIATLKEHDPDILLAAYHRSNDLFDLVIELSKILPEHKLYLRRKRCLPAWELNIFATKK